MSSTLSRAVAAASASTSTSASSLSSTDPSSSSSSINTLSIKPISEQVVVILGGTSGIGRACAFEFYKRGAKVVIASRSRFGVEKTCTDLEESNASHVQLFHDPEHSQLIYKSDRVLGVQCDAADSLHIQTVAHMTRNLFDRIDTWVHVAAVVVVARIEDSNEVDLQQMMNVNFFGAVRAAKTLIPIFKHQKGGGSLIFISSVEAKRTIINNGGYAATKHALNALIETLSQEFLADNVPINLHAVMPSTIDTPLFDKCRQNFKNGKKHVGVPLVYSPQLVADTVLYAASSTLAPRDLVVGTTGYLVLQLQKVFGRIMDYMLGWYGDKLEQTEQVISTRDNLYEPIDEPQFYATRGTWATWTHDFSLYNFIAEGKWWNLIYK